jgi:hypothetical protein
MRRVEKCAPWGSNNKKMTTYGGKYGARLVHGYREPGLYLGVYIPPAGWNTAPRLIYGASSGMLNPMANPLVKGRILAGPQESDRIKIYPDRGWALHPPSPPFATHPPEKLHDINIERPLIERTRTPGPVIRCDWHRDRGGLLFPYASQPGRSGNAPSNINGLDANTICL